MPAQATSLIRMEPTGNPTGSVEGWGERVWVGLGEDICVAEGDVVGVSTVEGIRVAVREGMMEVVAVGFCVRSGGSVGEEVGEAVPVDTGRMVGLGEMGFVGVRGGSSPIPEA